MSFFRKLFGLGPKLDYKELIANGALLIDVRTKEEFAGAKVNGSQNIPLDSISGKVTKLKKLNKPIVLCCASGMRSGMAASQLKSKGITEVYNGGSYRKFL